MKQAIWKFILSLSAGRQALTAPGLMKPLHFAMQGGALTMWASVWPDLSEKITRGFYIVATGQEIPPDTDYAGSVHDGGFVWHLFVEREYLIKRE